MTLGTDSQVALLAKHLQTFQHVFDIAPLGQFFLKECLAIWLFWMTSRVAMHAKHEIASLTTCVFIIKFAANEIATTSRAWDLGLLVFNAALCASLLVYLGYLAFQGEATYPFYFILEEFMLARLLWTNSWNILISPHFYMLGQTFDTKCMLALQLEVSNGLCANVANAAHTLRGSWGFLFVFLVTFELCQNLLHGKLVGQIMSLLTLPLSASQ